MDTLDISRRGLPKKEDLVDKFCDWCMKPEPFGKDSSKKSSKKTPTKKSPTKVASTSKEEKPKYAHVTQPNPSDSSPILVLFLEKSENGNPKKIQINLKNLKPHFFYFSTRFVKLS